MTKEEAFRMLEARVDRSGMEAVDFLMPRVRAKDLPRLIEAYEHRPPWTSRTDIVDLIGEIGTPAAKDFLLEIGRSKEYFLVRYFAIRNLIELRDDRWLPTDPRKLASDFYESLITYREYIEGRLTDEMVRSVGKSRRRWNGDHWDWLARF